MARSTLNEYYAKIVRAVAERSTCRRRAVGAVITDERGVMIGAGYNGVPAKMAHCTDHPCLGAEDQPGDTSRCLAVHAEINALLHCYDLKQARTMYVSCAPCFTCAKAICNTNITKVICLERYADMTGVTLLRLSGIEVDYIFLP